MIETHQHQDVVELRLARPPVNALNPELIAALKHAVLQAPKDGARAIILSGRSGMFSAGLDVPTLLTLDRAELLATWRDFFGLLAAVASSPVPVVAAITGHSPAGGAVISIYADYRVMAEGDYKIGLNEVQVGLVVPEVIQAMLRRLVGAHRAECLLVSGAMVNASEALRVGLVDALEPVDNVVPHALAWCQEHLALPEIAMRETRRMARADVSSLFDDEKRLDLEGFADHWFDDSTQEVLHAMVARLKARSR